MSGARNAFRNEGERCRGMAPAGLSTCIDDRDTCITNAEASLKACIATDCSGIVANGRTVCQTQCSCGGAGNPCGFNTCFVKCLDPYEQLRFTCTDNCHNVWQLSGGPAAVQACADAFTTCRSNCPQQ